MKDDNIEKREVIERYFKTMGLPGMARQAKHSQSASEIKEWEDFIVISERLRNRKNQKLSDHEVKPKNKKKIPDILAFRSLKI